MENIVSIINTHGDIYTIHHIHSIHHSHTRVNSLQLGILQYVPPSMGGTRYILIGT